jgi:hypothetical protein
VEKKLNPSTAIVTGLGVIGFGLLYYFSGILPGRSGFFRRWDAITAKEEPVRFVVGIFLTFVLGAGCLIWGVVKSMKR